MKQVIFNIVMFPTGATMFDLFRAMVKFRRTPHCLSKMWTYFWSEVSYRYFTLHVKTKCCLMQPSWASGLDMGMASNI